MFGPKLRLPEFTEAQKSRYQPAVDECERHAKPAATLLVADEHPGLDESRLGGRPAWPLAMAIPRDEDGMPLIFLAQIDCESLGLPDFPRRGLLQFFIAADDLFGCDFPSVSDGAGNGAGFRVVFHEDPSVLRHCPNYYEGFAPDQFEHPFSIDTWMESSFTFLPRPVWMGPNPSCLIGENLAEALEERFDVEDGFEFMHGGFPEAHVGGYPIYTQGDIACDPDHAEFDTVLLSLGSPESLVMFGDAGRANFLIRKDDLIRRDFSRVAYNWDCH